MALALIIAGTAGLLAGSFLNVVIWRGPALLGLVDGERGSRGTLIGPRSQCPACRAPLAPADLVPILSYVRLRGRCRTCKAPIPARYPLVEALAALACLGSVAIFGVAIEAAAASAFLLGLIALAAIDIETGYLPDMMTVPLIALGLAANGFGLFADFSSALLGAGGGYAAFWTLSFVYKQIRRRDGLGLGDAALFAAIGAWSGWTALAPTAFIAALLALSYPVARALLRKRRLDASEALAFGPYLCGAGALVFLEPFVRT